MAAVTALTSTQTYWLRHKRGLSLASITEPTGVGGCTRAFGPKATPYAFNVNQPTSPETAAQTIVDFVLAALDAGNPTPVVIIDGRAGSGKSTLADAVQRRLFKEGDSLPRVVHMDDLYDGWTGLEAGASYLVRMILGPLRAKRRADWQEYDWDLGARNRWREFEVGTPLIVEGCGSLSQASGGLADLRVWLEVPEQVRHQRWLARDGHAFDEQWPVWAAQELEFYARERSPELADMQVI